MEYPEEIYESHQVPSQDLERLQELELLVEGLAFNKAMEEDDGSRMSIDDFLAGKDFED